MARLANERASQSGARRELVADRLAELADRTPKRRAELVERCRRLGELIAEIDATHPALDRLADEAAAATTRAEDASRWIARLERVTMPAGVGDLAGELLTAEAAAVGAAEAVDAAEARLAGIEAAGAGRPGVESLETLLGQWRDHDKQLEVAAKGERAVELAVLADDETEARLLAARAQHAAAEGALEQARRRDLAADLAHGLQRGDDCPVCGQVVNDLPDHVAADLAAARGALDEATRARSAAEGARRASATERARVEQKLAGVRERIAELEAGLAGRLDAAAAAEALREAQQRSAEAADARQELTRARRAVQSAQQRRNQLAQAAADAWEAFDTVRDQLASLDPPRPGRTDLRADWDALASWAV
jgi:exonuclease SbcC